MERLSYFEEAFSKRGRMGDDHDPVGTGFDTQEEHPIAQTGGGHRGRQGARSVEHGDCLPHEAGFSDPSGADAECMAAQGEVAYYRVQFPGPAEEAGIGPEVSGFCHHCHA